MSDDNEEDNIFEDAEDEGIGDIGGGGDAGKLPKFYKRNTVVSWSYSICIPLCIRTKE